MPTHRPVIHDVIAIGLGPFNLGLACLLEPIDELDAVFVESEHDVDWHPGMLLEHSTVQTPFLADLVTLADPTSRFSFLNFLKETGRLYPFSIRQSFFPLRREFDDYYRWAAGKLSGLWFGHHVVRVTYDEADEAYVVHAVRRADGERTAFRGRRLVLGTGTPPHVPECCRELGGDALHNADYLHHREALRAKDTITIVGSGQSAAEIYHDLLGDIDRCGYQLVWITRSPRFFPLEYTKLTLEMTSPDYVDHFHALPAETRDELMSAQQGLYKGIDSSLIDAIYDLLYTKSWHAPVPTRLVTNTALTGASYDPGRGEYDLALHHEELGEDFTLTTQGLVLATGYRHEAPTYLEPIHDRVARDERGRLAVSRDYRIDAAAGGEIFVQNAELHTHGFVAPDLGMAAYRNSWVIRALLGREVYPIERSIAFQDFGVPADLSRPQEASST